LSQADHARYLHLKTLPQDRHTAATAGWLQGYEAGWGNAADRWMNTPQSADLPDGDNTTTWLADADEDEAA
jgi:hypothetical protein